MLHVLPLPAGRDTRSLATNTRSHHVSTSIAAISATYTRLARCQTSFVPRRLARSAARFGNELVPRPSPTFFVLRLPDFYVVDWNFTT